MVRNFWLILLCAAVLAFNGAGCGGDDDPEPDSGGDADTDTDTDSDTDECESLTVTAAGGANSVAVGGTLQFTAMCGAEDVTANADWLSVDVAIATISNDAATKGLATGVAAGSTSITATYTPEGGSPVTSSPFALTVTAVELESIAVTPENHTLISATDTQQYTATCIATDSTETDCTAAVTWASSNPAYATISAEGLASAVANGTTMITATLDTVTSNEATLTVNMGQFCTDLEVVSEGDVTTVEAGDMLQFGAYCTFGKQQVDVTNDVMWSTSDTSLATISNEPLHQGELSAELEGNVTVTAVFTQPDSTTISDDFALQIDPPGLTEIQVQPTSAEIVAIGGTQAFTAFCVYNNDTGSDCTTDVLWVSSATTVATIDASGTATAVENGTTLITADWQGVTSNTATLVVNTGNVCLELEIEPATATDLPMGRTLQYAATCKMSEGGTMDVTDEVTWESDATGVATIDDAGLADSVAVGTANISATYVVVSPPLNASAVLNVVAAVIDHIAIDQDSTAVPKGDERQLTATAYYTDGATSVITADADWESADTDTATITSGGEVHGVELGNVTITATYEGHEDTAEVIVTTAVLETIEVTHPNPIIPAGTYEQFTATGIYTDGTSENITSSAVWTSAEPSIVSISNASPTNGQARGEAVGGPVTITASRSGIDGTSQLEVSDAELNGLTIEVVPPDNTAGLPLGMVQAFVALASYTSGPSIDVTAQAVWDSSDEGIATISNAGGTEGQATGAGVGTTQISASYTDSTGTFTSNNIPLTVSDKVIEEIQVTVNGEESGTVARGFDLAYTATAIYSDDTQGDITELVTWSSGAEAVATVSNVAGMRGVAHGVDVGTTTITAVDPATSLSDSADIEVTDEVLVSIEIDPVELEIPEGTTHQFNVIGNFNSGASYVLTEDATWSVENEATSSSVGSILNTPGSRGLFEAVTAGNGDLADCETTVIVQVGTFTDSACVDIFSTEVDFVDVIIEDDRIPVGLTEQATCIVHYTDGRNFDITEDAEWDSQYPSVATVGNTAGNKGLITALSDDPIDETQIRCRFGGASDFEVIAVEACPLESISVDPETVTVPRGLTQQFTAEGYYGNCGWEDVTQIVTWESENLNYATISNADGSRGLAQVPNDATVGNSTTIQAIIDTTIGEAMLTVGDACVEVINVVPSVLNIPLDITQQLHVTAEMSDDTMVDSELFDDEVSWSTEGGHTSIDSDGLLLTTNYTPDGVPDLAIANLSGETYYLCDDAQGVAEVTVNHLELMNIVVTPPDAATSRGTTVDYTATGYYGDENIEYDITDRVYWNSTVYDVAEFEEGHHVNTAWASDFNTGETTITASLKPGNVQDTRVGSTSLTVTGEDLEDVRLELLTEFESCNPELDPCAFPGNVHALFQCVGEYSAGDDQVLTNALFSSDTPTAIDFPGDVYGRALTMDLTSGSVTATITCAGPEPTDPSDTMDVIVYHTESTDDITFWIITEYDEEDTIDILQGESRQVYAYAQWGDDIFDVTVLSDWHTTTEGQADPTSIVDNASNKGSLSALDGGVDLLYANYTSNGYGKNDSATVNVHDNCINGITISPGDRDVIAGRTIQYTAEFHYADGTTSSATTEADWSVPLPYATTTPTAGEFLGLEPGDTTVTVEYSNEDVCGNLEDDVTNRTVTATADLTVHDPIIVDVDVECEFTDVHYHLVPGEQSQCRAYGLFSDDESEGGWKDITDWAGTNWSTVNADPTDAVSVNNTDNKGWIIADKATTPDTEMQIRASYTDTASNTVDGDSHNFVVLDCELASIEVFSCMDMNGDLTACDNGNAGYDSLPAYEFSQAYAAEGTWVETGTTDDCHHDLWITHWAAWDTGNNAYATMADHVATTHFAGQGENVLIEATYLTITGSRQLEINDSVLDTIEVISEDEDGYIWQGQTNRYTAMGTFLGSDTVEYMRLVTQDCEWSSSETGVATINNTTDKGLAQAANTGVGDQSTIIECVIDVVSDNTVLWVQEPCLEEVTVSTGDGHLTYPSEVPVSFVARGRFSNSDERVLVSADTDAEVAWGVDYGPLLLDYVYEANHILGFTDDWGSPTTARVRADASEAFTVCPSGQGVGTLDITVDPNWILESITVLANPLYLAKGENDDLQAYGQYAQGEDSRNYDITRAIDYWVASDEDFGGFGPFEYDHTVWLGELGGPENVYGNQPGDAMVTAVKGLISGNTMVYVSDRELVRLDPRIVNITLGCEGYYYDQDESEECFPYLSEDGLRSSIDVYGHYSDEWDSINPLDVDSWTSSHPDIISIAPDGTFVTGPLPTPGDDEVLVTLTVSKTSDPPVDDAEIDIWVTRGAIYELQIEADTNEVDLNESTRWQCTGRQEITDLWFDVTGEVTWSSIDPGIASVENGDLFGGRITGESVGETTIWAHWNDYVSTNDVITVVDKDIEFVALYGSLPPMRFSVEVPHDGAAWIGELDWLYVFYNNDTFDDLGVRDNQDHITFVMSVEDGVPDFYRNCVRLDTDRRGFHVLRAFANVVDPANNTEHSCYFQDIRVDACYYDVNDTGETYCTYHDVDGTHEAEVTIVPYSPEIK